MPFFEIVLILLFGAIGAVLGFFYSKQQNSLQAEGHIRAIKEEGEKRLIELEQQQRESLREVRQENAQSRSVLEDELRERRQEIKQYEQRMQQKDQKIDERNRLFDDRENVLRQSENAFEHHRLKHEQEFASLRQKLEHDGDRYKQALENDYNQRKLSLHDEWNQKNLELDHIKLHYEHAKEEFQSERTKELERIAHLSREEARREVIAAIEAESRTEALKMVRTIEANAREDAERIAREIITLAIQRCASDQVSEVTVTAVPLPNEEMKGRIIGREGRNIRALEAATGVDLIIDDTPDMVILSSFDPVRREVARIALTKLIIDGRIHPTRIEEMVDKARQEVEQVVVEEGQRAVDEANISGLQPELVKMVGRLHFRTSYGQNVLNHSIEVAVLAGIMASELGADIQVCKLAGLLHDLGKAFDQEVEGPHALISGEIARRFNKSPKVIHAIVSHHASEADPQNLEAIIVQAADAISAARPGGRRETVDLHFKRLAMLEEIANAFAGVEKSFAVQAGREVRVIVRPEEVDELHATQLARDIARKIEESMDYPGQIKISVVRETRSVEYAK